MPISTPSAADPASSWLSGPLSVLNSARAGRATRVRLRRARGVAAAPLLALSLLSGCGLLLESLEEMREAAEDLALTGRAAAIETEFFEITTDFTIGAAVEAAVDEIRALVESQIPCSTVTVSESTVVIDLGTLEDECEFNGHTYAGVITLDFESTGEGLLVTHSWEGLTNGDVSLEGGATVHWTNGGRHVITDKTVTFGDRTVHVTSDRVQTLLDPDAGLSGGIQVDGQRHWSGERGETDLEIDEVEIRGVDPVPQAGSYTLTAPSGTQYAVGFERVDEDTIAVTFEGPRRTRTFHVTSTGAVSDA